MTSRTFTNLAAALTAVVVLFASQPTQAQGYVQVNVPQQDIEEETRSLWPLQLAGALVLGIAWISTPLITLAITGGEDSDDWEAVGVQAIPLAGPWVGLSGAVFDPSGYEAALVTSGLSQITGLVLLIVGSAVRVRVNDGRARLEPVLHLSQDVHLASRGTGLALEGRF